MMKSHWSVHSSCSFSYLSAILATEPAILFCYWC